MRELYKDRDTVDIKKKRLELIGLVARIYQGRITKYLRVNWSEVEEGKDLDCDGWKMLKRICGR